MSNGLSIIFTCFYALFDIVFMKHNVVYVFVILVDDDYCVAIHDLSPVLTALFSIELGGFTASVHTHIQCRKYAQGPRMADPVDHKRTPECLDVQNDLQNTRRADQVSPK